jgi:dTDP-4-dehydrorhamnose reductase
MRVLITGAGGQLGHDLIAALSNEELHPFDHAALNVADAAAVANAVDHIKPQWIINAAAFNDVDGAEHNEAAAFASNAQGPAHLAAGAERVGARLIHISTDYVFDGRKGSPYDEDDRPNPLSVYARSKYEGEKAVLAYSAAACVLRTAWLYGHHGKNFVKAIQAAAARGGPLRVVADQVGSPTSTADLAAAIVKLMRTAAAGLFHVVNAGACSRYEFARAIVGDAVEVVPITSAEAARPARRPPNSSLVSARWGSTGIAPLRSWQDALDAYLHA